MPIDYTLLSYAYLDVDEVKNHLNIPDAVTSVDERVTRHINEATDLVERYTDRMIKERTGLISYQSGRRNDRIVLPQWPVNSIDELWVDSTSEFTDTSKQLTSDLYRIEEDSFGRGIGVVLLKNCLFPNGRQNIKIVFDAGYQTVPSDIEGACMGIVGYLFAVRDEKREGTVQKSKNQENITYLEDFPKWILEILERYKRGPFEHSANIAVQNG